MSVTVKAGECFGDGNRFRNMLSLVFGSANIRIVENELSKSISERLTNFVMVESGYTSRC